MRFRLPLMLATVSALALAGCEAPNPYAYPNDPNARAKNGAITGALIGAGAGAILGRGDTAGQAIAGAALGALIGGAVGNSLDQQAADLRRQIGDSRIIIINQGNNLIVRMPEDILFATNSDRVRAPLRNDLQAVAENLLNYPGSTIQVIGHTDDTGTAQYNLGLSQRRAGAVAGVLIGDGVPPQRIQTIGEGESNPIASNATAAGRAQNRRVDIIIRPNR